MNFQVDQTEQAQLFAFSYRDLISKTSDVWLYIELFDQLELSGFNSAYSDQGQAAKEPRVMLRTIFYGLTHGIVSGRRLEDSCRNDNRYIVLSGDLKPDRRTFDRFLIRHQESLMKFFEQIVQLAQKLGLVSLGRVAIDGSRFKGNTGVTHSMQYEKMQRAIGYIENELNQLKEDLKKLNETEVSQIDDKIPDQIKDKEVRIAKIKRAKEEIEKEAKARTNSSKSQADKPDPDARKSLNDPEALSLADRKGKYQFGYNAQAVVDEKSQIVVACSIHPKATDYEALPELLQQVEKNCGGKPESVLADLGYKSAENVHEIESEGCAAYVAIGKDAKGKDDLGPLTETHFVEQVQKRGDKHYECLAGKRLPLNRVTDSLIEFSIGAGFCQGCVYATECKAFFGEEPKAKGRQKRKSICIPSDRLRASFLKYIERAKSDHFKDVYKRRKVIVEPVFGNIKNKGIRILINGRKRVSAWWKMACTAHNIEKVIKQLQETPTGMTVEAI